MDWAVDTDEPARVYRPQPVDPYVVEQQYAPEPDPVDYYDLEIYREVYRRERIRDQQMQHGAGGCAPDFNTGGCLGQQ